MYSSPPMQSVLALTRSSIGQKVVVAVTGLILLGFVTGHLLGNLIIFTGPELYNAYGAAIKGNLPLLWGARITLLASVLLHIFFTLKLASRNTRTGGKYKRPHKDLKATLASRTMIFTGPTIALFILFHLAHLTAGLDIGGTFAEHNVYANAVQGFRVWWVAAIYIIANAMLGIHLFHGAWSALQSLGAQHKNYDELRKRVAMGFALFIALGNITIPLAVLSQQVGTAEQLLESRELLAASAEHDDSGVVSPLSTSEER